MRLLEVTKLLLFLGAIVLVLIGLVVLTEENTGTVVVFILGSACSMFVMGVFFAALERIIELLKEMGRPT